MGDASIPADVLSGAARWCMVGNDALLALRDLPDECVDAVVTDPPYGLGTHEPTVDEIVAYLRNENLSTGGDFMGKRWQIPSVPTWREVFRVLKPGGHLLSFGGTRTFDLISIGLRAAGFESRDTISHEGVLRWMHGQGFPKSMDVSKAIDKAAGAEREVVGENPTYRPSTRDNGTDGFRDRRTSGTITAPATPSAVQWQGWGTALKPAWEPILVFRKPLVGTVAANVLEHGTGALNVDGCRVRNTGTRPINKYPSVGLEGCINRPGESTHTGQTYSVEMTEKGRWPSNLVLSHAEGCVCTGTRKVATGTAIGTNRNGNELETGYDGGWHKDTRTRGYASPDGTETVEAWDCVEGCPVRELDEQSGNRPGCKSPSTASCPSIYRPDQGTYQPQGPTYGDEGGASRFFPCFRYEAKAAPSERDMGRAGRSTHPTVKPVELMRWLCRLVTPPGGVVLDPFAGSGTTGVAALREVFRFIGVEKEEEYVRISRERVRRAAAEPRQLSLFGPGESDFAGGTKK